MASCTFTVDGMTCGACVATVKAALLGLPANGCAGASIDLAAASATKITVAVRIKPTEGAKTLMRFGPRAENALRFCHLEGAAAGTGDAAPCCTNHSLRTAWTSDDFPEPGEPCRR